MATYNNLITEEFVKETRTDGTVTSLTIKMVAYDGDNNMTTITGDGSTFLTWNDSTFRLGTVVDHTYYDWDNCTALASQTMTYTVPETDRTSLTQDFVASSWNASEQVEYQTKRKAWRDTYKDLEEYHNAWAALYAAVEEL